MIRNERPALPAPDPRRIREPIVVDSGNFLYYLADLSNNSGRRVEIASKLYLPELRPVIDELYETTQVGHVFHSDSRERLEKSKENTLRNIEEQASKSKSGQEILGKIKDQSARRYDSILDLQDAVERSRVLYYDFSDKSMRATDIIQGKYDQGVTQTFDVLEEGNNPMMEFHTHPTDSLKSPVDYWRMLARVSDIYDARLVKSAMVLCPNIQILAVVTPNTQFIPPETLDEMIERQVELPEEVEVELERLGNILVNYSLKAMEINASLSLRLLRTQLGKVAEIDKLDIPYEEKKALADELVNDPPEIFDVKMTRARELGLSIGRRYSIRRAALLSQAINISNMEFARNANPKLYFSTNREDFTEFSA